MRRRAWLAMGLASLALSLSACSDASFSFKAIDITGASYAQGFSLKDANGQMRQLTDFQGKVVLMFFGYTQCPDVCPTTMTEMAKVRQLLGKDGERFQAIFVTLDPERDTADILKAYLANFDPSFLALIPSLEELPKVSKDFKAYFKKQPGPTPTSYTLDHFAGSYVYDPQGRLRLFARYGMPPEDLAHDVRQLLK